MSKPGFSRDPLVRGIILELCAIAVLSLILLIGLRLANSRMGLSEAEADQEALEGDIPTSDSLVVPDLGGIDSARSQTVAEGPEASWPVTPCSLFVSGTSDAVSAELPEASDQEYIALETMLLVEAWAGLAGLEETQLDRIYTFRRSDTLYVDLPRSFDPEGLARTVEGRFVNYTRLVPLVSGATMDGFQDGLPLRGVSSNPGHGL